MYYTEKYHLPQWEETDRIMRTDFYHRCADMETGRAGIREAARMDYRAFRDQLLRMAYNHYFLIKDMDPFPQQAGVFRRDVRRVGVTGTDSRDDARYMALAEGAMSEDAFYKAVTIESEMRVSMADPASNTSAAFRFSCTQPGVLRAFRVQFGMSNLTVSEFAFRITLKNLDTGRVEWRGESETFIASGTSREYTGYLRPMAPFHANTNYRLTIEPAGSYGDGWLRFRIDMGANRVDLYGAHSGCTVTHTFPDPEGSRDGLAFVQYRTAGTGGTVTFKWDGQTVEPVLERQITQEGTPTITELVFRMPEGLPKGDKLALSFQCNMFGEMWFYEWGAVLC